MYLFVLLLYLFFFPEKKLYIAFVVVSNKTLLSVYFLHP